MTSGNHRNLTCVQRKRANPNEYAEKRIRNSRTSMMRSRITSVETVAMMLNLPKSVWATVQVFSTGTHVERSCG
jgi:hypothetical protein